jgi:uncharacterized protein YllA (UPF0747 family)
VSEPRVVSTPVALPNAARRAAEGGTAAPWYVPVPRGGAEWRARVAAVREEFAGRGRGWAEVLAPAFAASGAAAARLARAANGTGIVVTTGQQPGLFGGPVYTWSKALSAIALADAIEDATDIPTVPVYWAATYDADFAEAGVTHVAADGRVLTLKSQAPAISGRGMRDTPLGDVRALFESLASTAGAAAAPQVLDLVRQAYRPGETVGGAFVTLLRALLEPLGMPVLDAGHPAVLAAQRPLLLRALGEAPVVDAALRARDQALRDSGSEPQVAYVPTLSLVFASGTGERQRIRIGAAPDGAAALEPNVLLRPVSERAILPTAAYVAGPGELAYFAQSTAVADALRVSRPLAVPRWSGVIIEPHVQRILDRYDLGLDDLRDPHAALGRLVRARVPLGVRSALDHYRAALEEAASRLSDAVAQGTPPLVSPGVVDGVRHNIGHRLDRLGRRVLAATKRREMELAHHIAVARASLFPLDQPQERMLNLMPMLARHGMPLLDAMLDRARAHVDSLGLPSAGRATASQQAGGGR